MPARFRRKAAIAGFVTLTTCGVGIASAQLGSTDDTSGPTAAPVSKNLVLGESGQLSQNSLDARSPEDVPAQSRSDSPSARIRARIAELALNEKGAPETGCGNCFPKKYQLKNVVRPAEWCGVFVHWVWTKGGATKLPSMKPPKNGSELDQGHYATYWQKWGKQVKRWHTTPNIGDAIVYGNYPASTHVGIVVGMKYGKNGKVSQVRTVEGNVGDKVTDRGWRSVKSLYQSGPGSAKASGFVSPVVGG